MPTDRDELMRCIKWEKKKKKKKQNSMYNVLLFLHMFLRETIQAHPISA